MYTNIMKNKNALLTLDNEIKGLGGNYKIDVTDFHVGNSRLCPI